VEIRFLVFLLSVSISFLDVTTIQLELQAAELPFPRLYPSSSKESARPHPGGGLFERQFAIERGPRSRQRRLLVGALRPACDHLEAIAVKGNLCRIRCRHDVLFLLSTSHLKTAWHFLFLE
jgi:hypothetical protein